MEHMDDPPTPANAEGEATTVDGNADAVVMLTSMGFSDRQAKAALKATSNNVERGTSSGSVWYSLECFQLRTGYSLVLMTLMLQLRGLKRRQVRI